ncbi:MAG: hypothetical protein SOW41_08315 [Anaerococcus sp.]|nr:hypothetical protein [Peptoniphilaceae bacterium]MDY3056040.1 hypothetical protein [Anaerococcus sp.]
MKKKGFLTIYVLLLLLLLSLTVSFLYEQNKNDNEFNKDLYNKKQALYISESVGNLAQADKKAFETYMNKVDQELKKYYHETKILDKTMDLDIKDKTYHVKFDGKTYETRFSYINRLNSIRHITEVEVGNTRAETHIDYEVSPSFEFYSKKPIFYDFNKELSFKNTVFEEDPPSIDLEKNKEARFYKINGDLYIEDKSKKDEDEDINLESLEDKDAEEEENKEDLDKEISKNDQASKEERDDPAYFKGIMYIEKDLILETDLDFEGLLILKGNIMTKEQKDGKKPRLKLVGQIIGSKDLETESLDFTYDKASYTYIRDIENIFDTKFVSKRVY